MNFKEGDKISVLLEEEKKWEYLGGKSIIVEGFLWRKVL